jgi:exosome complex component RRP40
MDPTTGKDGGFGALDGGYVFDVPLAFARVLLFDPQHSLLNQLVKKCKFEIAIGLNGKIWINTDDSKHTLAAAKAIERCQEVPSSQFTQTINSTFRELGL